MSWHSNLFKRLKLVDEEELHRLVERQLREYNPQLKAMADRKIEIDNVLERKDLTPEEKLALVEANKQRYVQHQSDIPATTDPIPYTPTVTTTRMADNYQEVEGEEEATPGIPSASSLIPKRKPKSLSPESILDIKAGGGVPAVNSYLPDVQSFHKHKLNYLGALIEASGGAISRDPETDELMIHGETIEKSCFNDLIREFYVKTSKPNLIGQSRLLDTMALLLRPGGKWGNVSLKMIIPRTTYAAKLKLLKGFYSQKGEGFKKHSFPPPHPPGDKVKLLRMY